MNEDNLEVKLEKGFMYRINTIHGVKDLAEILYRLENEDLNLSQDKLIKIKKFCEIEIMNLISERQ